MVLILVKTIFCRILMIGFLIMAFIAELLSRVKYRLITNVYKSYVLKSVSTQNTTIDEKY